MKNINTRNVLIYLWSKSTYFRITRWLKRFFQQAILCSKILRTKNSGVYINIIKNYFIMKITKLRLI